MNKPIEPDDILDDLLQQAQRAEAAKRIRGRTLPSVHMSNPTVSITSVYGKPLANAEPINEREMVSIYALVAHVAHNQNVRQEKVREVVKAQFNVSRIENIQRDDYQKAINFLIDLRLDEIN
jgi:hypothetical protein